MHSLGAISHQSQSATTPQPRLVQAAHEFEAQLMKELLKPVTSGASVDGEESDDAGSGGALADFASEALGQALSKDGGLGIATSILHSLSRNEKQLLPNVGGTERNYQNISISGLK